jgi:formylglycine-generating enzyme required for sulfatase activity
MLHSGDQIGPYTLINKIGRGAFGIVWLSERRTTIATTTAALKIPLDDDVDLETIRQEANLWIRASGHPNVLPIIEANVYDEQVVIASEYAPDGSLESLLKQHGGKAPSIDAAVEIVSGILSGLEHLHSRDIIHRDLKPANILFQGKTPRLADFGISRVLKSTSQSSIVAGTPAYMAPEAFDGKRNEQTDIWSVGVIFYQLLAGRLPFPQTDITSLVGAILSRNHDPLPISIPSPFQQIIARALAKDPGYRYKTAAEMRADLRNPASINQGEQREAEQGTTIAAFPVRTRPQESLPSQPKKQSSVPQFAYIVAALLVALIIGAAAMAWLKSESKVDAPQTQIPSSIPTSNQRQKTTQVTITMPPLNSYQFDTATLDFNGNITDRHKGQARYFTEDLSGGVRLEMTEIAGGTFLMGSPASEARREGDEGPQHRVTVPTFYMGRYEVTQAQWQAVMGDNPSSFSGDNLPAENVSWNDAIEFCKRLSQNTGRRYRLPSEAEWEYACRAGTTTPFAFGETITTDLVNYNGNSYGGALKGKSRGRTIPVGSLGMANRFGLYDMHGNLWEWCQDLYHITYNGAPTDGSAWESEGDTRRILRGGGWLDPAYGSRSADRYMEAPNNRRNYLGLRVVMVTPS